MSAAAPSPRLYTARFFRLLLASFFCMSGASMQAHFAQFVARIGGDVSTVGWLVGLGMIGSMVCRPLVGRWIDRYGCRLILVVATVAGAGALLLFQWTTSVVLACVLRSIVQVGMASFLTAFAVMAAQIAPPLRSAESLAVLGVGGLAGMAMGPTLGDVIFTGRETLDWPYHLFFSLGAVLMLLSALLAACAPGPLERAPAEQESASFIRLVRRHWPGAVVVIAFCMACVQTIPGSFLERLAEQRGFSNIKLFFLPYAPTAILLRVVFRRAAGLRRQRVVVFGMLCYAVGIALLVGVHHEHDLILPAVIMGTGHCFAYPFVVDLAAEHMPRQHRGVATSFILLVVDIGFLFSNIAWGQMIDRYSFNTTLVTVSLVCLAGVAWYAWAERRAVFGCGAGQGGR